MTVPRPLVGFYGDDFTGSSENLAQFHRHGLKARLYIKIPAPQAFAAAAACFLRAAPAAVLQQAASAAVCGCPFAVLQR